MENSILYTFSTIAQALGGAFALLAAFVLFRFQSLDASMLNASTGLRRIWRNQTDRFPLNYERPRLSSRIGPQQAADLDVDFGRIIRFYHAKL